MGSQGQWKADGDACFVKYYAGDVALVMGCKARHRV